MTAPAVWPLESLLDHLRGLHELWANEAADRLEKTSEIVTHNFNEAEMLRAQLAAVVAALDQYDKDHRSLDAEVACVSAIAKAVGR